MTISALARTCRVTILGLTLFAIAGVAIGCVGDYSVSVGDTETVRGLVRELNSKSLLDLEFFVVEDNTGNSWKFEAMGGRYEGFTPSHLREHMTQGLSLTVTFHREDGHLVVDSIED